ncbi:OmpA family protein [Nitrospira lenta]|uniref:Outer membrane protein, OmpA/MotB family n=1 Tax=Nitrospira lenta TaxID=1436998 RepID=A0A330L3Q1_9BACT
MNGKRVLTGSLCLVGVLAGGCSGNPVCCDGGYEYRHRNAVPVAEPIVDDRDERLAALERDRQRQLAATAQLQDQVAELQRQLTTRPQPPLTQTYTDLLTLLRPEIERGTITVQQSGDQITIHLADRLLFESGEDRLKPAGTEVLRKVGGILRNVPDRHLRVTGHTDNVPIGGKLIQRFPSNTVLSRTRAAHAREALEQGGAVSNHIAAEGYGESHPLASNVTEDGRRKNRRVEIVVLPQ